MNRKLGRSSLIAICRLSAGTHLFGLKSSAGLSYFCFGSHGLFSCAIKLIFILLLLGFVKINISYSAPPSYQKVIPLQVGVQQEFPQKIATYSLGKKGIISLQMIHHKLYVKGVSAGVTDLIFWDAQQNKKHWLFVVYHQKNTETLYKNLGQEEYLLRLTLFLHSGGKPEKEMLYTHDFHTLLGHQHFHELSLSTPHQVSLKGQVEFSLKKNRNRFYFFYHLKSHIPWQHKVLQDNKSGQSEIALHQEKCIHSLTLGKELESSKRWLRFLPFYRELADFKGQQPHIYSFCVELYPHD